MRSYSLLTDTNNISKPPFRSCSILVPIRYASFRQAVPIFRFVSIFLIKNAGSELSVQYIQRHVDKLAPRWVGRRRSAARHRLSMSWSCYDDDQLSCCSVFTEIGSRRSRTDQRIGDGGWCNGAHRPMRGGGLLKGITATHRNLCVGTRVGIGGSPSNTNRGVQPTCIELCGCCGLLLSPTSDAWWWSLQGDRNRASDRGGKTHIVQVGGSPYNTKRGVQPTCVRG